MIQVGLDLTLFLQIVQFLLIVFIANKFILKPVKSTIDARNAKIDGLLQSAEGQLDAVEASKDAYDKKLVSVRNEIAEYQRKVRDEASQKVSVMLSEAKDAVSKTTSASRVELEKAIVDARAELNKDVKDISDMIYRTISGNVA